MKEFNQHIKLSDMARLLSRSSKQFKKDVEIYNIPCIKLGRTLLFNSKKVTAYLYELNSELKTYSIPNKANQKKGLAKESAVSRKPKTDSVERYKRLVGLD